jgi:hypothetical protein
MQIFSHILIPTPKISHGTHTLPEYSSRRPTCGLVCRFGSRPQPPTAAALSYADYILQLSPQAPLEISNADRNTNTKPHSHQHAQDRGWELWH